MRINGIFAAVSFYSIIATSSHNEIIAVPTIDFRVYIDITIQYYGIAMLCSIDYDFLYISPKTPYGNFSCV